MEMKITKGDRIISFGSCFATEIGKMFKDEGYNIMNNPFGVLFNPVSIYNSISRLLSRTPFTMEDVIERDPLYGKNSGLVAPKSYASFYHHGSFASPTPDDFLAKANNALAEGSDFLQKSSVIIVTFGTSWVFRHLERDIIVSNCHKIPSYDFRRERLDVDEIVELFTKLMEDPRLGDGKEWIFTVSPIRHLKDGLHGNQISKAILHLAIEKMCASHRNAHYFPSYEIVLDELRDYSYFAQDTVHPSEETIRIVWERFRSSCCQPERG
ncbi:MAG: GSCFA domain-containing protein [Bacteroidales bacterium]|nr:GSCFA domain-containing protein [Bacteroidales bacterium]